MRVGWTAMRALVRRTHELRRFEPHHDLDWDGAERRVMTRDG